MRSECDMMGKKRSSKYRKGTKRMKYFLIILLMLALFFTGIMIYDVNRFATVKYKLTSPKLKKAYRFVLLSDLHNKQFGKENEKLFAAIEKLRPDGILMAGDMITAKIGQDMKPTLRFIQKLAAKYPVFYGQGNHEYRLELYPETYQDMFSELQAGLGGCGIEPMKNCHVKLPQYGITIYGAEIERKYYQRFKTLPMDSDYLKNLLGNPDPGVFTILIAHNPEYFPEYEAWGADLVLSGHVHGGLMRLPFLGGVVSPAIRLFPKYDGGLFHGKTGRMILSRGLGTHTLPIRIFNPGELILVELEAEKNSGKG